MPEQKARAEAKPEMKPEAKPETKIEGRSGAKSGAKPARAEAKVDAKAGARAEGKGEARQEPKADPRADAKAEVRQESGVGAKARPEGKAATPELRIREAVRGDEPFLREMAVQVLSEFGDYRQSLREWLREQTVVSRIVETAEGPIGFYMMEVFPGPRSHLPGRRGAMMAYLLAVAVRPEWQRRGVGKRLMDDVLAYVQGSRPAVAEVRLSVAEGNMRARRLFAQYGFQDSGLDSATLRERPTSPAHAAAAVGAVLTRSGL